MPGGGVLLGPGGEVSLPGGSAWSGGVLLGLGGCLPAGGFSLVPGGWSAWSGGGVSAWSRGGCLCLVPGGFSGDPPVNRITDTCKNITLATTSLRPVITCFYNDYIISKLLLEKV